MEQFVRQIRIFHWFVTFFVLIAGLGMWLVFRNSLPPQVPLFYSLPWGEGQLTSPLMLLLLPGLAILSGVGFGFGTSRYIRDVVLVSFMLLTSMVVQLVLLLSLIRILMFIV